MTLRKSSSSREISDAAFRCAARSQDGRSYNLQNTFYIAAMATMAATSPRKWIGKVFGKPFVIVTIVGCRPLWWVQVKMRSEKRETIILDWVLACPWLKRRRQKLNCQPASFPGLVTVHFSWPWNNTTVQQGGYFSSSRGWFLVNPQQIFLCCCCCRSFI